MINTRELKGSKEFKAYPVVNMVIYHRFFFKESFISQPLGALLTESMVM